MKKKTILSFMIISLLLLFSKQSYAYFPIWSNDFDTTEVNAESYISDNFLNIESESAILIEQNTGNILFEKNPHKQLRPASVKANYFKSVVLNTTMGISIKIKMSEIYSL